MYKIQMCIRKGEGFRIGEVRTNRNHDRNGQDEFHCQKKPASVQKAETD